MELETFQLEAVHSHSYKSEKGLTGRLICNMMGDRKIFQERIAYYVGQIQYPPWLGGRVDIIQMNRTTVALAYNEADLEMPTAEIRIYGSNEDVAPTKNILERLLNMELIEN